MDDIALYVYSLSIAEVAMYDDLWLSYKLFPVTYFKTGSGL